MKALESLCESSKDPGLVLSALRCVASLDRGGRPNQVSVPVSGTEHFY